MRNYLLRLRLPLVIFLVLSIASCIIGYAIINFAITSHTSNLRDDYFHLKTEYLEINFPKDWFGVRWEDQNQTSGYSYTTLLLPVTLRAVMYFRVYDEKASQTFMEEHNLNDAFSINIFEVNQIYEWSLQNNDSATLFFIENSTISVSGREANHTIVSIRNGLSINDATYNLTGTFMSWIDQQKIAQIVFYGEENDFNQILDTFRIILDSTRI